MSTTSLSVEAFTTDLNYLGGQAHYALESMPSLGLESADPDQGLMVRLTEKIKAFFRWMGELITRFVKWITGQTAEEKKINAQLDRMVKAGVGGKGELTEAEAIKNALRPQLDQLAATAEGQAKLKEQLEDVKKTQAAIQRAEAAAERFLTAKNQLLNLINSKSSQLLFVRLSISGRKDDWAVLNVFFHEIFHGLASYQAREVARHSDEAGLVKSIEGYLKEYEEVKARLGVENLADGVRSKFAELDKAVDVTLDAESIGKVLTGITGNRNYFGDAEDIQKAVKEMADHSANLEKNLTKALKNETTVGLVNQFLRAYRDSITAAMVFSTQAVASYTLGREFSRGYYKAWDELNVIYEIHKPSPNKYDKQMVASLVKLVPSLGH